MTRITIAFFAFSACAPLCLAQTRSSANYTHTSEGFGSGGVQAVSSAGNYLLDASNSIPSVGISTKDAPQLYTAKQGLIAQLTDLKSLELDAVEDPADEETSTQLSGRVSLDDDSLLQLQGAELDWSIISGPVDSINMDGLASLAPVLQDTDATVEGTFSTATEQLTFTVAESNPDNFGAYGGDGLDDLWQVGFFGQPPNPDAAPSSDPDFDGQNNRFENLSGFDPTDPTRFFQFIILDIEDSTVELQLNQVVPGTRYTISSKTDLRAAGQTDLIQVMLPFSANDVRVLVPTAGDSQLFFQATLEEQ